MAGIDSEVPSVLVIFDGSVLHDGLAAAAFIGFFSGSDELDLPVACVNMAMPSF